MKIIIEQIEGNYYAELVLNQREVDLVKENCMIQEATTINRRNWYFGVRMESAWDEEENNATS